MDTNESVNWIHLAQDRAQYWVLVNTVMDLLVQFEACDFSGRRASDSLVLKNASSWVGYYALNSYACDFQNGINVSTRDSVRKLRSGAERSQSCTLGSAMGEERTSDPSHGVNAFLNELPQHTSKWRNKATAWSISGSGDRIAWIIIPRHVVM